MVYNVVSWSTEYCTALVDELCVIRTVVEAYIMDVVEAVTDALEVD